MCKKTIVKRVNSKCDIVDCNNFNKLSKNFITEQYKSIGCPVTFQCHNVTIMKNAQGDRVIIQEVK